MRKPPAFATSLLVRLGEEDDALAGDLLEEFSRGRSRTWYWRQVLAAISLAAVRHLRTHPLRAAGGVAIGWLTLGLVFLAGDQAAGGLAGWLWDWNRQTAYATGEWRPFWIAAFLVSYSGFALSAAAIVRVQRRDAGPTLILYAATVFAALAASSMVIEVLSRRNGAVPVPHPLFYVISVALPYHWRSGLLLAPLVVLAIGFLGRRPLPARDVAEDLRRE
jgi:hypothetical protein